MGDSGKPFSCTEIGCNQRFVNEDHLEVHRRKHELSLGLGNFKSLDTPVIADQTPTPTRFLKNCEEIGLFNEPPNPFDALFRKASERRDSMDSQSSKTEQETSLDDAETVVVIEDVTEQVIEESSQHTVQTEAGDDDTHLLEETVTVGVPDEPLTVTHVVEVASSISGARFVLPAPHQLPKAIVAQATPARVQSSVIQSQLLNINRNTLSMSTPILLRLPNGQTIPVVPPSVANPSANIPLAMSAIAQVSMVLTAPTDTSPMDSTSVKQKLKNTLLTSQSQGNMGVMTQAVDVVTRQQAVVTQMVDETGLPVHMLSTSPNSQIRRKRRNSEADNDVKREKFLERNRAAATRCRNKRKSWITSLEQKADELNETNTVLMTEVTKLREEVAQLKQLLLAHSECPVTVMQRQSHATLQSKSSASGGNGNDCQSPSVVPMKLTKQSNSIKTEKHHVIRR